MLKETVKTWILAHIVISMIFLATALVVEVVSYFKEIIVSYLFLIITVEIVLFMLCYFIEIEQILMKWKK